MVKPLSLEDKFVIWDIYYYSTFSFSFISKDILSAACSALWEAVRFLLASHSDLWLLQNCDNESDMYGDFSLAWISEQWSCWPWWPQVSQYFPWGAVLTAHPLPPGSLGISFTASMDFPFLLVSLFSLPPKSQAWKPYSATFANVQPENTSENVTCSCRKEDAVCAAFSLLSH